MPSKFVIQREKKAVSANITNPTCPICGGTSITVEKITIDGTVYAECLDCKSCGPVTSSVDTVFNRWSGNRAKNTLYFHCCPFCGSASLSYAFLDGKHYPECLECGSMGSPKRSLKEAKQSWRQEEAIVYGLRERKTR